MLIMSIKSMHKFCFSCKINAFLRDIADTLTLRNFCRAINTLIP